MMLPRLERPDSAGSTALSGLQHRKQKGLTMSTTIIQRCDELRERMKPLGEQLDELDNIRAAAGGRWSDEQAGQYRQIDAEYDKLFDQLCDEPWSG